VTDKRDRRASFSKSNLIETVGVEIFCRRRPIGHGTRPDSLNARAKAINLVALVRAWIFLQPFQQLLLRSQKIGKGCHRVFMPAAPTTVRSCRRCDANRVAALSGHAKRRSVLLPPKTVKPIPAKLRIIILSARHRWRLLGARIVIPTRFHSIEVSTMGPTRNYDKGQKGEKCKYQSHGINSLLRVPQC
jgi:hypothetical protein